MIRRPPRSTLFPLHDALPIFLAARKGKDAVDMADLDEAVDRVIGGLERKSRVLSEKEDRKSTRLNSSHRTISYAVFCLKKKKKKYQNQHCFMTKDHKLYKLQS